MPNHIENELIAAAHVLDTLRTDGCDADFNAIVPMPECLDGDCGEHINDWAKLALGHYPLSYFQRTHKPPVDSLWDGDFGAAADTLHVSIVLQLLERGPYPKDFADAEFAMLIKRITALKTTGFVSWYEWRIEHWGTKWNAYEIRRVDETTLRFQTAWSAPLKIVDALSAMFPHDDIRFSWADEDTGANTGIATVRDGNLVSGGSLEDWSHEAYKTYLRLHHDGVLPDHMQWTADGKLAYKPESEEIAQ